MNSNNDSLIRSSKTSILFSNKHRLDDLYHFIDEYQKVVSWFTDFLWNYQYQDIPKLIPKEITSKISDSTWLSARAIQCAAKQASGIVRGSKKKTHQRQKQIQKFTEEGKFKKARVLQRIANLKLEGKPDISTVCPELDSRFVKINMIGEANHTSFDGWLVLSSLGNRLKIEIPFKKTKHFNKMLSNGKLKDGIRISKVSVAFNFEIQRKQEKTDGNVLGLDIGIKSVYSLSNGLSSKGDKHGWNLDKIQKKLSRKKKGSQNFQKAVSHRKNHINWSLNQIDLSKTKILKIEDIKHLRRGHRTSRYMSHWIYADIKSKLESLSLENGVRLSRVNPTYTSQRCSQCGWVRKSNRKKKRFVCQACGYAGDADLNASFNISLNLPEISEKKRLSCSNRTGFYWHEIGKEPIVPTAREA